MRERNLVVPTALVSVAMLAAQPAAGNGSPDDGQRAAVHETPDTSNDGALVVSWNQLAYELAFAEDEFQTFKGVRAFSMMHIAIHAR
jgi:hypothetical protein